MRPGLSLVAVGHATSLLLAISFSLCVAFDLLFPEQVMYQVWCRLLPGFTWIKAGRAFYSDSWRATLTDGTSCSSGYRSTTCSWRGA